MPAVRSVRRDVILRVPKVDIKTRRASASSQMDVSHEGERAGPSSGFPRRSMSPAKRSQIDESRRHGSNIEKGEEGYEYAAQATSAAEWNSLLIWARRQRGPQWDAATGIWQVDEGSTEYYSFANDPARHSKLSTAVGEAADNADSNSKPTDENQQQMTSAIEGHDPQCTPGHHNIEDSPPIGPGGRRSRMR